MKNASPLEAIRSLPAGTWTVAVSGGADSVALLLLLHHRMRSRNDLKLHVAHLDHELRGQDSTEDANFVRQLANDSNLPCTIARRSEIESRLLARGYKLPANSSSRYRIARLELFAEVTLAYSADGVILAHHLDDRAETVLQRLLRGSGPAGLAPMRPRSQIHGITVLRPLLNVRREVLRQYLDSEGQRWREDASNQSRKYLRNRLRPFLAGKDELVPALCDLADSCADWQDWLTASAPVLPDAFSIDSLRDTPPPLLRHALGQWLVRQGSRPGGAGPDVIARLFEMVNDAASPARQMFPKDLTVRRRAGIIFVDKSENLNASLADSRPASPLGLPPRRAVVAPLQVEPES